MGQVDADITISAAPDMRGDVIAGAAFQPVPFIIAQTLAQTLGDAHSHVGGRSAWGAFMEKRHMKAPFILEINADFTARIAVHPADLDFFAHCLEKTVPVSAMPTPVMVIAQIM